MSSISLKRMKVLMVSLGLIFSLGSYGFAEDISIELELSARQIPLGSAAQLSITVNGGQDADIEQIPTVDGLTISYVGPSTRVSIVNGRYSASKTFTFSLFPQKEGQFEIPAFNILISGRTYQTDPVMVEVKESASSSPGQPASLSERLFLVLEVPKKEIYLNERLNIKVLLFVSGLSVTDIQHPKFDGIGFSIGNYRQPRQYQTIVDGLRYEVVEFQTEIYPTRTGELKLGPVKSACNILVKSPDGGGRRSVFGDDFFNAFFDRQQKRPVLLEADAVTVNVLDLPQEGRPDNFSQAVGKFSFNVSVSPAEVKEGDPITLRMTVMGEENLAAIKMPLLPVDSDLKLYDPQIFEKDNIKRSEQVIIPKSHEVTEVPAISFSYFDPELKKYQTLTRGPFPIKVIRLEDGDTFKVVGLQGDIRANIPETFGQDVVFIKSSPGRLVVVGKEIYRSGIFYGIILLFAAFWLAGFVHYKRTARIRTDSVYARRLQAPRQARQGLAQANKLIAAHKKEAFYDVLFKTLRQYLGNKFHLPSGAVTFETVQDRLRASHVDQRIIDDIKLTYEECDMVRYASADISQENMHTSYQRLAQAIDHLERLLK